MREKGAHEILLPCSQKRRRHPRHSCLHERISHQSRRPVLSHIRGRHSYQYLADQKAVGKMELASQIPKPVPCSRKACWHSVRHTELAKVEQEEHLQATGRGHSLVYQSCKERQQPLLSQLLLHLLGQQYLMKKVSVANDSG